MDAGFEVVESGFDVSPLEEMISMYHSLIGSIGVCSDWDVKEVTVHSILQIIILQFFLPFLPWVCTIVALVTISPLLLRCDTLGTFLLSLRPGGCKQL
jgi:hypothetical protein